MSPKQALAVGSAALPSAAASRPLAATRHAMTACHITCPVCERYSRLALATAIAAPGAVNNKTKPLAPAQHTVHLYSQLPSTIYKTNPSHPGSATPTLHACCPNRYTPEHTSTFRQNLAHPQTAPPRAAHTRLTAQTPAPWPQSLPAPGSRSGCCGC